jgi:hypothetical protein
MVSYRSKQFAIEDTSDSFRNFISLLTNQVRSSNTITILDNQNIEIVGQGCTSYRYSNFLKTIEKSEGVTNPCNSSFSRMIQDSIIINSFSFTPTGTGVNIVNVNVEGVYKDSIGEKPFSYSTTITKRI